MYARQVLGEENYAQFEIVSVDEFLAYLGFCVLMGLVHLPAVDDYWRKDEYFRYSPISDRISRSRFREISRYLHFADNSQLPQRGQPGYDKLGKVRPVLEALQSRFLQCYNPHCEQSIDEAMIKFQGRSTLKQFMPAKPTKRGIKVWCRADGHNGYLCEFQVYTGREESNETGLGARVVTDLSQKLQGKHFHLFFDNFFCSFSLLRSLLMNGLYGCGTARQNYKDFPALLKMQGNGKKEREREWVSRKGTVYTMHICIFCLGAVYTLYVHIFQGGFYSCTVWGSGGNTLAGQQSRSYAVHQLPASRVRYCDTETS